VPHPIVLNHNPFIGVSVAAGRDAGTYRGKASETTWMTGSQYSAYGETTSYDDAQVEASRALGGREHSAIIDLDLEIEDKLVFPLLFFWERSGVEATGKVIDVTPPRALP